MNDGLQVRLSSMPTPWTWSAQLAACSLSPRYRTLVLVLVSWTAPPVKRPPPPESGDSRSAQLPCASLLAASRREIIEGDELSFFLLRATWMHHENSHRLAGLASTIVCCWLLAERPTPSLPDSPLPSTATDTDQKRRLSSHAQDGRDAGCPVRRRETWNVAASAAPLLVPSPAAIVRVQ
jgi:hypothetical protein